MSTVSDGDEAKPYTQLTERSDEVNNAWMRA